MKDCILIVSLFTILLLISEINQLFSSQDQAFKKTAGNYFHSISENYLLSYLKKTENYKKQIIALEIKINIGLKKFLKNFGWDQEVIVDRITL